MSGSQLRVTTMTDVLLLYTTKTLSLKATLMLTNGVVRIPVLTGTDHDDECTLD